jgi:hypothetical protein
VFGFGKSKKQKEYENSFKLFSDLHDLLIVSSVVPFLEGNSERKQVIMAIFFETIIFDMFDKYGEDIPDRILNLLLKKMLNDDLLVDKGFDSNHVNIARKLVQLDKDKTAISVSMSANNIFKSISDGEDYAFALNNVLMDKNIKWSNIDD